MGLGDDLKEFENDATGQGGNDGDNNANRANGSNDKTEDTLVDSGNTYLLYPSTHLSSPPCPQHHSTIHSPLSHPQLKLQTNIPSNRPIRLQGRSPRRSRPRGQQPCQRRGQQVLSQSLRLATTRRPHIEYRI
jgi:hypothetical protein